MCVYAACGIYAELFVEEEEKEDAQTELKRPHSEIKVGISPAAGKVLVKIRDRAKINF